MTEQENALSPTDGFSVRHSGIRPARHGCLRNSVSNIDPDRAKINSVKLDSIWLTVADTLLGSRSNLPCFRSGSSLSS